MGCAGMIDIQQAERLTEDDRGQAAADEFLARALLAQQAKKAQPAPQFTGVCLNCGEASSGLWCDGDCQVDYGRRDGRK